jgi:uncharacterized membrane protein YvbJ
MANFCIYCDNEYPETTTACKECGRQLKHIEETKQNRVILGKIQTKNVEYENNDGWGPTILIIFGLITSIILIGIPCILIGIWWSYKRADNRKMIATEIDVLEKELE